MSSYIPGGYPNRTLCDVLSEMRKCYDTRNFAHLLGLIEEAQWMGNRMEAGLQDGGDLKELREQIKEKRKELITLKNEVKLTKQIKELK